MPEIIDQHRHRLIGKDLAKHLGGTHGRAGVADQRVRHSPRTLLLPEEGGSRIGRAPDKANGLGLAPGMRRADRGGVGHHLGHLGVGAMPRIHRQKGDLRKVGAHRIGVVGGNASRANFLQQDCLEIDEIEQRASHVKHRVAGPDPGTLRVREFDIELLAAFGSRAFEQGDREARRADDRATHEYRVGRRAIAEMSDDRLGPQKIAVGLRRKCGRQVRRHRQLTRPQRGGLRR
jgi:hypothetical protein